MGAMKRRLAADIGQVEACRFYRRTLMAVSRRLAHDRRWTTRLVVTPNKAARVGRWCPPGVRRLPQGGGDLGRRMARALMAAGRGLALLVGSDVPGLDCRHLADAFQRLAGRDYILGPAADGGFWLVGARPGRARLEMFRGVRWSTPHALGDTLEGLKGRRIAFAATLDDVDDGAAWAKWKGAAALRRYAAASDVPGGAASARRNCTA
ncbi:MAG: DUF2064 domain-containing protein [Alphaproteobacteria bacterium]|nr:DUF2064 domain-containing protein [Alphaproteobacteria bacterium]